MFSAVVCSVDPPRFQKLQRHYQDLFGVEPFEIIPIGDARSMSEAYNRGIARARGEVIIFSHDDIEFLAPETWLSRLKGHLASFDIVGIAGTNRLQYPAWAMSGPPYTFGQIAECNEGPEAFRVRICSIPAAGVGGMQALDGVFLAVRRAVFDSLKFDESFDGFHHYDLDFTYRAFCAGKSLAVAADLPLLHESRGKFDDTWNKYAALFMQKHGTAFPPPRARRYQHATVYVNSREEILEILGVPILPRA